MKHTVIVALAMAASLPAEAEEWWPRRQVVIPYRYQATPVDLHSSFNPGSPRWFVPGYGYQVPAVAYRRSTAQGLSVYRHQSDFGSQRAGAFYGSNERFWVSPTAVPWFLPGATTGWQMEGSRFDW